jgi:hypothetical protein
VTIEALFEPDGEVIQVGRTRATVRASGAAHFAIDTPAMLAVLGGEAYVRPGAVHEVGVESVLRLLGP